MSRRTIALPDDSYGLAQGRNDFLYGKGMEEMIDDMGRREDADEALGIEAPVAVMALVNGIIVGGKRVEVTHIERNGLAYRGGFAFFSRHGEERTVAEEGR